MDYHVECVVHCHFVCYISLSIFMNSHAAPRAIPGIDYVGLAVGVHCLNSEGKILLVRRSVKARDEHGTWDKIGGGVKHAETLRDAALREVFEETNCKAEHLTYLGFQEIFREHGDRKTHWICMLFSCIINPADVVVNIPEADAHGWFDLEDLPTPLHSQFLHQLAYLKQAMSPHSGQKIEMAA